VVMLADDSILRRSFLNDLAEDAKYIASDTTLDYESQLISLSALLFGYWSLRSMNSFVREHQNDRNLLVGDDPMNLLKKPHAAQVVAVWMLLNCQESRSQVLKSHMCELKTGEGKSIVLGVTATILALMGGDVDCVCYSSYLSQRDYTDFEDLFKHFGVASYVTYGSIDSLCRTLCGKTSIHQLAKEMLQGSQIDAKPGKAHGSSRRFKILLVDEVDVLFKEDFLGRTFNPVASLRGLHVSDFLNYIWDNLSILSNSTILRSARTAELLRMFPSDVRPLIEDHVQQMLRGAISVKSCSNTKYSIVENRIAYKYLDGVTTSTFHGYETAFAYIKEQREGRIVACPNYSEYYCVISPRCGQVSYAELPTGYDVILGVTGTLSGIGDLKMNILKDLYGIHGFSHVPSVYGNNKLQFAGDCPRGTLSLIRFWRGAFHF
jgi:SecA DEAD-like domain